MPDSVLISCGFIFWHFILTKVPAFNCVCVCMCGCSLICSIKGITHTKERKYNNYPSEALYFHPTPCSTFLPPIQGSTDTALAPGSHVCRNKAPGLQGRCLAQTANLISTINLDVWGGEGGGGDPKMLKKRYWPFSSHQMGETLTRFESDLLETVPLRLIVQLVKVMV